MGKAVKMRGRMKLMYSEELTQRGELEGMGDVVMWDNDMSLPFVGGVHMMQM